MKTSDVPQDNASTYGGHKKVFYATNDEGEFNLISSTGWEVEGASTETAIEVFVQLKAEALTRIQQGSASVLEWHMYNSRMDIELLAQISGLFKWQIKRHLKPKHFASLKPKHINKYCEAMGLTPEQLFTLPEQATS